MKRAVCVLVALLSLAVAGSASSADFNPSGVQVDAVEGVKFSGVVATFTDSSAPSGARYSAEIVWGDGEKSSGTVVEVNRPDYQVRGEHNYVDEGTYQMHVTIQGTAGVSGKGEASPKAVVVDAPLTLTMALPGSVVEGGTFNGTVATFKDGNLDEVTGAFSVKIDWGDGSSSAGSVAKSGPGSFTVSGSHTFGKAGPLTVKVRVDDKGGSFAESSGALTVNSAPLTAGAAVTVKGVEGKAVSGVVATFKDGYAGAQASDYTTVTIDWGDGKFTPGTVTPFPAGGWQISGMHLYADEGQYKTSTVVKDSGGATVAIPGFAVVVDAPIHAKGLRLKAKAGKPFKGTVATFTDENPKGAIGDFGVTIDWGDGTKTDGRVAKSGRGFTVSGRHTYKKARRYVAAVRVSDRGGAYDTAKSPIVVSG